MELAGGGLITILHLVAVVYAVLKIVKSSTSTLNMILWIAIVLIFPCVGLIVWYFIGPK